MTISNSIVKKVITTTQGRYLLRLPNTEGPHPLLIGFHGYGENADVHLRQLERITGTAAWLVASVQALHWFYDRTHQHVVASWMTKLCREQAIVDNLRYIERVVTEILEHHDTNGHLVYEGFSQGASMAYRAASAIRHRSDGLIVLAGDIPPELRETGSLDLPPTLIGRGIRDEWFTQERYDADLSFLASCGVTVEPVVFDGGHEWTDEFRSAAGKLLASHIQPA
ncbi:MAG: phospholipase [Acidobacteria bacterium]|nr:phospholipase [Acidobacteriota bacterium]